MSQLNDKQSFHKSYLLCDINEFGTVLLLTVSRLQQIKNSRENSAVQRDVGVSKCKTRVTLLCKCAVYLKPSFSLNCLLTQAKARPSLQIFSLSIVQQRSFPLSFSFGPQFCKRLLANSINIYCKYFDMN